MPHTQEIFTLWKMRNPSEVYDMASATQVAQFIAEIAPIAQRQAQKHGNKIFPSVCIGQAAKESGFGTAPKMVNAKAIFGVKVGKSAWKFGTAWKGAAYKTGTTEYYDGVNAVRITDYFRAYSTLEDSVEDYMDMLCHCRRYKNALNRSTPRECIQAIWDGGYATDPKYVSGVMSIINQYGLTKYDSGNVVEAPKEIINGNPYKEPTKTLRMGNKGNDVRWLQFQLNRFGYGLIVDGIWGNKTQAAVIDFQTKHHLVVDALVGARTRAELINS